MSPALAEELTLDPLQRGVIVMRVVRRDVAGRLGIRPGDYVVEINGASIDTVDTLERVLKQGAERWQVVLRRDGRKVGFTVGG
jgi:S1-C subfamily serine protease